MPDHFGVMESHWREAVVRDENFAVSEAPHFIGRAIVALASGPAIMAMSGKALATRNRAKEYGFTDLDCTQPDWGSHPTECSAWILWADYHLLLRRLIYTT